MDARQHRISRQASPEWNPPVAGADQAPPSDDPCADVPHVGVVFVHGVGFQVAGETLLNWSEPLIRLIREHGASGPAGDDPTIRANLNFSGADLPFIELAVGPDDAKRHWILSEAFWASSIEPPSLPTVISWLGAKGGAARAVDHLVARQKPNPVIRVVKGLFIAGLASVLLVVYSVLRTVLSLLPGSGLKQTVLGPVDSFLTAWSGDMRTLLSDPAQARVVRDRIAGVVTQLRSRGCDDVVIVAHSGGAVASYLTLAEHEKLPVKKLVTFGEGLRIAFRLLDVETFPPYPAGLLGRPITSPDRPIQWFDYWASDDPVPAGALDADSPGKRPGTDIPDHSIEVSNRWSFRQDHGTYWDNEEEFAIPVLRHIDRPNTDGNDSAFYASSTTTGEATNQRYRRLGILGFWRSFVAAAAFAAIGIGSAGVAYHVYAKAPVEAGIAQGDMNGGIADAWDTYWGRFTDESLQKRTGNVGGPVFDVGRAASQVWGAIPGTDLLAGPTNYLRSTAGSNLAVASLIAVGMTLWPAIIALGSLNAWPRRRWAERWTGPGASWLSVLGLLISVTLIIGVAFGPIGLFVLAVGTVREPIIAAAIFAAAWVVIGLVLRFAFYGRMFWRLWTLVSVAGVLISLLIAPIASAVFGQVVVGSLIVLLSFSIIGSIGDWRWRARDDHERRAVRTGQPYRFPKWWDAAVGGMLVAAVVLAVAAVAVGSVGGDPGWLLFIVVGLAVLAVLMGLQLDQYLNEPARSSPPDSDAAPAQDPVVS